MACGVAVGIALVASLLMPKRYTSTASILIEPPAGTDARTFTAISPIYLESLKTYETFAQSGTLFQWAADKFQLRGQGGSIESIKARVLKVTKLRDTKVLQINVTLEDPKRAQAVAQFLAEETVKLINTASRANGRDQLDDIQRQVDGVRKRLDEAHAEMSASNQRQPVETLRTELDSLIELQGRMRRELYEAEASAAAYDSQSSEARVDALARRTREVEESVKLKTATLAEASSRVERLDAARKTAQSVYDAAVRRQQEVQSWVGSSGEWLQVIDAGIVPERPSEPRPLLYAALGGSLAILGALVYLSLAYGMR